VANFALHKVFENINPEFLTMKENDQELTDKLFLGFECLSGLILLGFWKKCLFIINK
jgi:hypothetical protein